ncbi:MAG: CopG family transcriptional regulator [Chloroflexota bacterium]|nr:CopG family transcriptional regulator [Chloroflexota bacterium]
MIRTQIQLTEEQHKFLREAAAEYNISMAALVRQSVDLLVQKTKEPSREEQKQRALSVIGIASDVDGATDVSINHDKYLAEIYAEISSDDDTD